MQQRKLLIDSARAMAVVAILVGAGGAVLHAAEPPAGVDLDVTYIERTPRYARYCVQYSSGVPKLCPGTERLKRWPDAGEIVTYTAHVLNKGTAESPSSDSTWQTSNGVVARRDVPSLAPGQEATVQPQVPWPSSPERLEFRLDPLNAVAETFENNNTLAIGSHDLALSIWVEQGQYDALDRRANVVGTYSFEDWIQAHFAKMNERFAQARYPVTPEGIVDRLRLDKLVIAEELDGLDSPMRSDPDEQLIDGRWQFTDGDPTNARGELGSWQAYADYTVASIEWALLHEMTHQLGVIDLYRFGLAGFAVRDHTGALIPIAALPTVNGNILFVHPGMMGGGDTAPHYDGTYYESHTAGGMNAHARHRRGYYGEYLYDTPTTTTLKIVDILGQPLPGAQVALYQKGAGELIDDVPEVTGTTDAQGLLVLPNRPVTGVTTATGHTLTPNPFGQIDVVGTNGTMFVRILNDQREYYDWLYLLDLNMAYWAGQREAATITIPTDFVPADVMNIARGKPATQSSTVDPAFGPSLAVDGNTDGNLYGYSVSHTKNEFQPWWQVDLGQVIDIGAVRVWNRTDADVGRTSNFDILVSDAPFVSGSLETVREQAGVSAFHVRDIPVTRDWISVLVGRTGRYVRVQLAGTEALQLAEVEVFSRSVAVAPPPAVPAVPASLAATATSRSQIRASWNDVAAESRYELQRSTRSDFSRSVFIVALAADQTAYLDAGLKGNTTYYYRLRACNATGCSSYTAPVSARTLKR